MKFTKEQLLQIIKEEVSRAAKTTSAVDGKPQETTQAPAQAGADDARKALAHFTLKKVLRLAKAPLEELAQKGDEIAKQEFLTILATKLGIDIKDSVQKLGRLQGTQDKRRAAGE
jgi:hypothetical protein